MGRSHINTATPTKGTPAVGYIYLASPYSHPDPAVRLRRYFAVRDATTWLLRRQLWVYSPIVHCHDLVTSAGLPTDFAFWAEYNYVMIDHAEMLFVLTLEGHTASLGVAGERRYAQSKGIPVLEFAPPPADGTAAATSAISTILNPEIPK